MFSDKTQRLAYASQLQFTTFRNDFASKIPKVGATFSQASFRTCGDFYQPKAGARPFGRGNMWKLENLKVFGRVNRSEIGFWIGTIEDMAVAAECSFGSICVGHAGNSSSTSKSSTDGNTSPAGSGSVQPLDCASLLFQHTALLRPLET